MQVFVKAVNGDTLTLVDASDTVGDVKAKIEEIEGIPVADQRLVFEGKEMADGRELSYYKVRDECTLHLMLNLKGGGCVGREMSQLAYSHLLNYNICRKCYCRLPPRATRCRKAKCGRTTDIRPKKPLIRNANKYFNYFGRSIPKTY